MFPSTKLYFLTKPISLKLKGLYQCSFTVSSLIDFQSEMSIREYLTTARGTLLLEVTLNWKFVLPVLLLLAVASIANANNMETVEVGVLFSREVCPLNSVFAFRVKSSEINVSQLVQSLLLITVS